VRIWHWSKRNPKFAGALAASIVLAMLNVLAVFAISHLLSIVDHSRLSHHTVASTRFQDVRELPATVNTVTGAMKSLGAADAKIDAVAGSAEEADADVRAGTARQGIEL
jgi:hypothetical protein